MPNPLKDYNQAICIRIDDPDFPHLQPYGFQPASKIPQDSSSKFFWCSRHYFILAVMTARWSHQQQQDEDTVDVEFIYKL